MLFRCAIPLLGSSLLFAGAAGCSDSGGGPGEGPGFLLEVDEEAESATLAISGDHVWFQNTIADADYESWWTKWDDAKWSVQEAPVDVVIRQSPKEWLGGNMRLDADHELDFVDTSFGFGWRALYPEYGDTRPFDLEQLDIAPDTSADDRLDANQNFANCEVTDTRILVALSQFDGTMDELWALAQDSAADQGLPAPEAWRDIVGDPLMYEFLFGLHKTMTVSETTFAFLSLQMDPLCGNVRVAYRTERDLIGPVDRVVAE